MKNQRLVKALEEMDKARWSARWSVRWSAVWSASRSASGSAVWSAGSASRSAYWSVKTNEKEVLKILKGKLTAKEQKK